MSKPIQLRPATETHPLDSNFEHHVRSLIAKGGHVTMTIGPDEARVMLHFNTGNRPLTASLVKTFAKDMTAGKWLLSGEPIIFSSEGVLNDGQHRLFAVLQSGAKIVTDVRFGIERRAFQVTDLGKKRSTGDMLSIDDVTNAQACGAALRLLFDYEGGDFRFYYKLPPQDVRSYLAENPKMGASVTKGIYYYSHFRLLPVSIFSFSHYVLSRLDGGAAETFFQAIADGTGNPHHPADAFRRLLTNSPRGSKMSQWYKIWCLFHAWNLFRQGKNQQKVEWGKIKDIPEPR